MSWLSSALNKIGVSSETQRALTKPALVAAAPFTGGATLAALPFVNNGGSSGQAAPAMDSQALQSAVLAGFSQLFGGAKPTAPVAQPAPAGPTPLTFWQANKTLILVGVGGLAALGVGVYVVKKAA